MDPASAPQIWQAVLGEVQLQVTGPIFATYLRDTVGARFDGHTLTVAAPSDFVREHLASRLRPLLAQALCGVTGNAADLSFEVAGVATRPAGGAAPSPRRARCATSMGHRRTRCRCPRCRPKHGRPG